MRHARSRYSFLFLIRHVTFTCARAAARFTAFNQYLAEVTSATALRTARRRLAISWPSRRGWKRTSRNAPCARSPALRKTTPKVCHLRERSQDKALVTCAACTGRPGMQTTVHCLSTCMKAPPCGNSHASASASKRKSSTSLPKNRHWPHAWRRGKAGARTRPPPTCFS